MNWNQTKTQKLEIPSSSLKSAIFVEKYARYYMLSNIANNISELCHLETNELLETNDRPGDDGTLRSV